jgi:hypothetical protein
MPIKTFRGQMIDGAIDTISLHTNNGAIGYIIKKFQVITKSPGASSEEDVVQIFSVPQTTAVATIDFSDQTLLAVSFAGIQAGAWDASTVVIFDNMIVNQDIYVTFKKDAGSSPTNYYIELEQVKLDLNENTVATLKDIRNVTAPT